MREGGWSPQADWAARSERGLGEAELPAASPAVARGDSHWEAEGAGELVAPSRRGRGGGDGGLAARTSKLVLASGGAVRHRPHRAALAPGVRAPPVAAAAAPAALRPLSAIRLPAQLAR